MKPTWRKGFSDDEVIRRVRPTYSDDYLHNPHKGTATFQRFEGDALYPDLGWDDREGPIWFKPPRRVLKNRRYPPTRISYCRWLWSVLEPKKGQHRWDILDGALQAAAERGQSLQIRTQPYISDLTPQWYWELGGKPHAKESKAAGYLIPDHNDPLYIKHWSEHIRALGKRYDGHPALESFDVAYGGACGETGGNATAATARKLVDVYLSAFKKTSLVSMLGTDGCAYAATKNRAIGWRADCYGDCRTAGSVPGWPGFVPEGLNWNHMLEAYPKEIEQCGVKDAWKTAPVTLETCWTVAYWEKQGWDIDWIIEQGYKYHVSVFMPKSVYIPDAWMDQIMTFNKRIGYRFFVHNLVMPLEVKRGGRLRVEVEIDNRGIAPIYRAYKFAFRFTQGKRQEVVTFKEDIRKWLPDFSYFSERISLPENMQKGAVDIACAIVDETLTPVVKFAMKPLAKDGWHPLASIGIV